MKEVEYTLAERQEVADRMEIFAANVMAKMIDRALRTRHENGEENHYIELSGNVDGVEFYAYLGPEGRRDEDVILIEGMEDK